RSGSGSTSACPSSSAALSSAAHCDDSRPAAAARLFFHVVLLWWSSPLVAPLIRDRHVAVSRWDRLLAQNLKDPSDRPVAEAAIPRIQDRLEAIEQEAAVVRRGQRPTSVCPRLELRPEPLEGFTGHPLGELTPTDTDEAGNVRRLVPRD